MLLSPAVVPLMAGSGCMLPGRAGPGGTHRRIASMDSLALVRSQATDHQAQGLESKSDTDSYITASGT